MSLSEFEIVEKLASVLGFSQEALNDVKISLSAGVVDEADYQKKVNEALFGEDETPDILGAMADRVAQTRFWYIAIADLFFKDHGVPISTDFVKRQEEFLEIAEIQAEEVCRRVEGAGFEFDPLILSVEDQSFVIKRLFQLGSEKGYLNFKPDAPGHTPPTP